MLVQVIIWTLLGLFALGAALYAVGIYNTTVRLSRTSDKSFGNLDSILKQRHDEIPKLVDACRAYVAHEKGLLERIAELRTGYEQAAGQEEKIRLENLLNRQMRRLQVTVEAYPDLKASTQFLQVLGRITELENSINDRRELFNEAVTGYNIFIAQFPALLVARSLGFVEKPLLETPQEEKEAVLAPFSCA